ncbi:hypothetical protein [Robertkochia aurantiaca]|uniref:hypothetical protein n=1 Tax=Robertkochia aurantiaca TaxID=2873700 RepID=UPI001CCDC583|nr:hypothetical protein [Robertkochia sp. 3YJGBD-33]
MVANDDVLAVRAHLNAGLGDVDFEQQVVIGNKDIRDYSLGEFRGDGKIAVHTEYHKNCDSGLGLVGFFGLATLYGADNYDYNWKLYPGIGTGFRYTAIKKNKLKVGLDTAVGDGDWGIHFRIGEAF